jgi:hypothetical protein
MKSKVFFIFNFFGLVFLISSCLPPSKPESKKFTSPEVVAVLPLDNYTNDMDGPLIVRYVFHKRLKSRGYSKRTPLDRIDEILTQLKITDAHHLKLISPQKLAEELKVDGLFYGELLDFRQVSVGVYSDRIVQAKFKLVDGKTGQVLWEKGERISNAKASLGTKKILESFISDIAIKWAEKITNSHLRSEVIELVEEILSELPRGYNY